MEMRYEKDIIFHINKTFFPRLSNCVGGASPNEASGLLFGSIEQHQENGEYQYHYKLGHFECVESKKKSPIAFLMNDDEILYDIARTVETVKGLNLIGIFHSHPSGTNPSGIDHKSMRVLYDSKIRRFRHLIWIIMDSQNKKIDGYMILNKQLIQILIKWE